MCLQKFKATVFVPKLTDITSIVEVDVDSDDSKLDIEYKLIRKLDLNRSTSGVLLSNMSRPSSPDYTKLIQFERVLR